MTADLILTLESKKDSRTWGKLHEGSAHVWVSRTLRSSIKGTKKGQHFIYLFIPFLYIYTISHHSKSFCLCHFCLHPHGEVQVKHEIKSYIDIQMAVKKKKQMEICFLKKELHPPWLFGYEAQAGISLHPST